MKQHLRKSTSILLAIVFAITLFASPIAALTKQEQVDSGLPADFDVSMVKRQLRDMRKDQLKKARESLMDTQYMNEKVRIMVELDEPAAKMSGTSESMVLAGQQTVRDQVTQMTGTPIINEYAYLANGFSLMAKRSDISKIRAMDGVRTVSEAAVFYPDMFSAVDLTAASQVWEELGYHGEGMLISIIDTGIDVTHKDMRISDPATVKFDESEVNSRIAEEDLPGKYFTEKVAYGYNYADKNQDVLDHNLSGEPEKEADVSMHGMHVAGIAAANATDEDYEAKKGIRGVAPEAQLLAMKVFSNDQNGGAWSDDILMAIEDSVKMGADVINMSLGSPCGFSELDNAFNRGITAATDAGTLLVLSAGNEGLAYDPQGHTDNFTGTIANLLDNMISGVDSGSVGADSTHPDALSVASIDNVEFYTDTMNYTLDDDDEQHPFFYHPQEEPVNGRTFRDGEYVEIVDIGSAFDEDIEGIDLTGKYALALRGGSTFEEKATNAASVGAIGIFIRDNRPTTGNLGMLNIENSGISSAFLWQHVGNEILGHLEAGERVFIDTKAVKRIVPMYASPQPSAFTSWGPSPEFYFKPEVAGVGGNIYSTMNGDNYATMSGTSMSAPHTAGASALIMQAMADKEGLSTMAGRERVMYLKQILSNTASAVMDDEAEAIHSPRRVGAGLINVKAAIDSTVTLECEGKPNITLKNISGPTSFDLTFKNRGTSDVNYEALDAVVYTANHDGEVFDYPIKDASLSFSETDITVPAGGTKTITITLDPGSVESNYVEGYIEFESDNAPKLSIPYLGFAGSWENDLPIFDFVEGLGPDPLGKGGYYNLVAPQGAIENLFSIFTATSLFFENDMLGAPTPASNWLPWIFGAEALDPWGVGFNNDPEMEDNSYVIRELTPQIGNFRGIKNVETYITDEEGNELIQVGWVNDVRKPVQYRINAQGRPVSMLYDTAWDGKLYDQELGEFVLADEGQYFQNVRARMSEEGDWQEISIPVKIDNTAPVTDFAFGSIVPYEADEPLQITMPNTHDGDGVGIDVENSMIAYVYGIDDQGLIIDVPDFNFVWDKEAKELKLEAENPLETGGIAEPLLTLILISDYVGNDMELMISPQLETNFLKVAKLNTETMYELVQDDFIKINAADYADWEVDPGLGPVMAVYGGNVARTTVNGADSLNTVAPGLDLHAVMLEEAVPQDLDLRGYDAADKEIVQAVGKIMYDITPPEATMDEEIQYNSKGLPFIETTDSVTVTVTDNYEKGMYVVGMDGSPDGFFSMPVDEDGTVTIPVYPGTEDTSSPVSILPIDFVGNEGDMIVFFVQPEGLDPELLPLIPDEEPGPAYVDITTPGFEGLLDNGYVFYHIDNIEDVDPDNIPITLEGYYDNVGEFTIDGEEVTLNEDGTWSHDITIREGLKYFNVNYFEASTGLEMYNTKVTIYADGTVPNISFETDPANMPGEFIFPEGTPEEEIGELSGNQDPLIIYTNKDKTDIKINGLAYDNTFGYKLKINGNVVLDYYDIEGEGPEVNARPFEWVVEDAETFDFIRIEIEDLGDFESPDILIQKLQVQKDLEAPTLVPYFERSAEGETKEVLEDDQRFDVEEGIILSAKAQDDLSGLKGEPEIWVNGVLYDGEPLEAGIYGVVFRVTDNIGNETIVVRNLIVYGDPDLEVGADDDIYPEDVEMYDLMEGVSAMDPVFGDLTDDVTYEIDNPEAFANGIPGTYVITYTVKNEVGRSASATKQIRILGRPEIYGVSDKTIEEGTEFDPMKDVTAYDNEDGDLTDEIIVEGYVDINTPGEYTLTYHVYDSHGNKAMASCTVTVKAKQPEPTVPVEPTEPVEPIEPTEPVEPIEPTEPVEPIEPTEPVEPIEPTEPVEPIEPTEPVEPTEPPEDPVATGEAYPYAGLALLLVAASSLVIVLIRKRQTV